MKDTLITVKRKKIEFVTFIVSIVVAEIINMIGIIKYNTSWSELYTQFVYVLCIGCAIYAVWTLIRIIAYGIKYRLGNVTKENPH